MHCRQGTFDVHADTPTSLSIWRGLNPQVPMFLATCTVPHLRHGRMAAYMSCRTGTRQLCRKMRQRFEFAPNLHAPHNSAMYTERFMLGPAVH